MTLARATPPAAAQVRLARALRLRCPACGARGILQSWLRLAPQCSTCGFHPDRGEHDHFLGGYVLNLGIAEALVAVVLVVLVVATWPTPPWEIVQWVAAALVVLMPIAIYPFTRLVFLAVDMKYQPERPGDYNGN